MDSLITKFVKRKDDFDKPELTKGDIHIYVVKLDEPTLIEKEKYCIIGYFSQDYSKFRDIFTRKVYFFEDQPIKDFNDVKFGENHFSRVNNFGAMKYFDNGNRFFYTHTVKSGKFNWLKQMQISKEYYLSSLPQEPWLEGMESLYRFMRKGFSDAVSLEELQQIESAINRFANKKITEELEFRNLITHVAK